MTARPESDLAKAVIAGMAMADINASTESALVSFAEAADALAGMAVDMLDVLIARGVDVVAVMPQHVGAGARFMAARAALLAALRGETVNDEGGKQGGEG